MKGGVRVSGGDLCGTAAEAPTDAAAETFARTYFYHFKR